MEESKPQIGRLKEIVTCRAKMNEMETKKCKESTKLELDL